MSLTLTEMKLVEGWLRVYPAGVENDWWMSADLNRVDPREASEIINHLEECKKYL